MRRLAVGIAVALLASLFWWARSWLADAPQTSPAATASARELTPAPTPPAANDSSPDAQRTAEVTPPTAGSAVPGVGANSSVAQHPEWKPVKLDVLDRRSSEPLKGVEIGLTTPNPSMGQYGVVDRFLTDQVLRGDSPLQIPPAFAGLAVAGFLVRAQGHASATIALDFESGGSREVRLDTACELRLFVDVPPGEPPLGLNLIELDRARAVLERQAEMSRSYAERLGRSLSPYGRSRLAAARTLSNPWTDAPGQLDAWAAAAACAPPRWVRDLPGAEWQVFDRLDAGDWIAVVVERGDRQLARAAAVVRLEPGTFVERRISVRPPIERPVRAVEVSGTIVLFPGWDADEATRRPAKLEFERAGGTDSLDAKLRERVIEEFVDEGGGCFRWSAGELADGTWFARLPQYGSSRTFEVSGSEPIDVPLEVGPPCDVELTIRERTTEELADIGSLTFWTGDGDGGSEPRSATRDEARRDFRFRAPLGTLHVHLDLFDQDYFVTERAFALSPGSSSLVFEVEKRATLRPRLTDGDTVVPWSDSYTLDARRPAGSGSGGLTGWIQSGRDFQYVLSPAGRYVVRAEGVPGFEPSDPIEVDLLAGKVVDVTIPLKRER
jgi:hypothetical protein